MAIGCTPGLIYEVQVYLVPNPFIRGQRGFSFPCFATHLILMF